MTVTVACEECGKIYHIPRARLTKIKGKVGRTKCKECGNLMILSKPEAEPAEPAASEVQNISPGLTTGEQTETTAGAMAPPSQSEIEEAPDRPETVKKLKTPGLSIKGLGLRGNMTILFLVVPIVFMAISGMFLHRQLNTLASVITGESTDMVTHMAENLIAESGRSVAKQCQLYLSNHPDMRAEDFYYNMKMRQLAVQKVGMTGFTSLYAVSNDGKPMTQWVHPDPEFVGVPLKTIMRKTLKGEFGKFNRIVAPAEQGKNVEHSGYYLWPDKNGKFREKFMYNVPIEGTNYGISTTTSMDEFMLPVKRMEVRSNKMTVNTRNINFSILLGTLFIIGTIVALYGHRLIYNIRQLTDITDRISVGELDVEIKIDSGDEIGQLAEAISRMQDSLRFSIERLRRRR